MGRFALPSLRRRSPADVPAAKCAKAVVPSDMATEPKPSLSAGGSSKADESKSFAKRKRQLAPNVLKTLGDDARVAKVSGKALTEDALFKTVKETLSYFVFLALFCVVAFTTRSSADFWANRSMNSLFVESSFFFGRVPHEKTLRDVLFVPLFYQWLEGAFFETIYTPETESASRFLNGYNRIIGPVRLRQLRVRPDSCPIPAMFAGTIDTCYAPYAKDLEEKSSFGPAGEPQLWRHSEADELDGMDANGRFATYSGGGYVVDLPTNASSAAATVASLKANGWIDRATRAVFIDLGCFNANTGSLLSVRLLFEFLPTGGVEPFPMLRVLRPLTYEDAMDYVRGLCEALFVSYTLFYFAQEARELRKARRDRRLLVAYWTNAWNVLDWMVAVLSMAIILLRFYVYGHTHSVFAKIEAMGSEDDYVNLQPLMWQLQQVQNVSALTSLLLFLKVFKYLATIPQMDLLFATLRAHALPTMPHLPLDAAHSGPHLPVRTAPHAFTGVAGFELLLFSLLFTIVILGYAMSFYIAFGLDVHSYRSITASLISLFEMVLGVFDYDELSRS